MRTQTSEKKGHRYRKNGASREHFAKLRHETNALRGKQIWVEGAGVGYWTREAA
jgi:hypothetical protein